MAGNGGFALALERLEQGRLLAADVRAGAAVHDDGHVAEQPSALCLVHRRLQHVVLRRVLAADVDEDRARLDRVRCDEATLDEAVRDAQHDLAVLERPRLRFVRVHGDVDRLRDLVRRRDEARLASGREERAAAAAQVGRDQLFDHLLWRHRARPLELRIAADRAIRREVTERLLLCASEDESRRRLSGHGAPRRSMRPDRASPTAGSGGRPRQPSASSRRRGTRPRAA